MKIEAGKCYKSRSGKKIGPMIRDQVSNEYPWDCETTGLFFKSDGTCPNVDNGSADLIEEWIDDQDVTPTETKEQHVSKYKVGEKVRALQDMGDTLKGNIYTVIKATGDSICIIDSAGDEHWVLSEYFSPATKSGNPQLALINAIEQVAISHGASIDTFEVDGKITSISIITN